MSDALQNFADSLIAMNAGQSGQMGAQAQFLNSIQARGMKAEEEAKLKKREADIEAFLLKNPQYRQQYELLNLLGIQSQPSKTTFESFGIYDINDGSYMGAVNKGDTDEINKIKKDPNLVIGSLGSPNTAGDEKLEFFSVTDGGGNRIGTLVNPTKEDINNLNKDGYFLNKLPVSNTRGEGANSGKTIKGWNDDDGLKSQYFATHTLINTGERLLDQLFTNPKSVLTAGDLAQVYERVKAEFGAIGGRPENYTSHLKDSQQSEIADLATEAAVSESMLLDFTFQIAAARGQTGRGLSDRDFQIFTKIISAGSTAPQKAAALSSFIDGISQEVQSNMQLNYDLYNQRLGRDAADKEAITIVQGINDLRKIPFKTVVNPFVQTAPSTPDNNNDAIDNLLKKYGG